MHRQRAVKILATLGPASSTVASIKELYEAGADLFRINMSHADRDILFDLTQKIRSVEEEVGRPLGILVDLQGPKIRLGRFQSGSVELSKGDLITLDANPEPGTRDRVHLPHPEVLAALKTGDRVLIDDGRLHLRAVALEADACRCKVISGSRISDRKGVSLPDTELPSSALTDKDRVDLANALEADADWVALSFVQRPEDIAEVRTLGRGRVGVLAKIEKPQALERLHDIISLSDAIMIARGDLGVETPLEAVPGIQKQITRACRQAGKPVVVATQMLESMILAPVPTRAEVSDVATAVFDGADAVMLSAESAAGDYPVEAVATMDSIARAVERDPIYPGIISAQQSEPRATAADAISAAARQIAATLKLSAIVCYTSSGTTGLRAARERPIVPIIALSPIIRTARRLSIVWGLHCVVTADAKDLDDMVERACSIAVNQGIAKENDGIIISAGVPLRTPGATNMLRIANVSDASRKHTAPLDELNLGLG